MSIKEGSWPTYETRITIKIKKGKKDHLEFATFRVCCLCKVARKAHWQKNPFHKRLKINLVFVHNLTLRRAFLMKTLYNKSRIINILYRRQRRLRFTIFRFLFFSFLFFFPLSTSRFLIRGSQRIWVIRLSFKIVLFI